MRSDLHRQLWSEVLPEPNPPRNAFTFFAAANDLSGRNGAYLTSDELNELTAQWSALPAQSRQPFEVSSKQDAQRYNYQQQQRQLSVQTYNLKLKQQ